MLLMWQNAFAAERETETVMSSKVPSEHDVRPEGVHNQPVRAKNAIVNSDGTIRWSGRRQPRPPLSRRAADGLKVLIPASGFVLHFGKGMSPDACEAQRTNSTA